MNTEEIISQLEQKRDAIAQALAALNGTGKRKQSRRGKRKVSKAARLRMSRAQKARWKASRKKES